MPAYTVAFTNIPDNGLRFFDSLEDAIQYGRDCGFEFTVWFDGKMVASWTVFGGLRRR